MSKILVVCEHHEHVMAGPKFSDLEKLLNKDDVLGLVIANLSLIIQDFLFLLSLVSLGLILLCSGVIVDLAGVFVF